MRTTRKKSGSGGSASPSADSYFQLIRAFPLRRIRTSADHAKAKAIYLRHSAEPDPDAGTRDYLDVLADLIAEFEERTNQTVQTEGLTAQELVRHRLAERGMSVSELARDIGIAQPNLSEMLNGRRDWSKAAIRELSKKFNIRAERFLT